MASCSMLTPPSPDRTARFADDFAKRVLLTVDTEEEFDWDAPFRRDGYGLDHVEKLARFQTFCEEIEAHPVYLVDWPITQDKRAVEIIGEAVKRGKAEVGVQLHPWVNPPFDEEVTTFNSFAGNLPSDLEAAKLTGLRNAIEDAFGTAPIVYRAGRYGLGDSTADLLKASGISIDTSVRSLFDYSAQGGPDYTHHPLTPYWIDDERTLLELPVTSVYWGVLRQLGKSLHRAQRHVPTFFAGFSKLNLLERIALTPEGVTAEEAIRGIDIALDDGLPLLVLSFHSPSLAPGHTPYCRNEGDVEQLYDWFRQVYGYLGQRAVTSATLGDVLSSVKR
ncbi:polysaccharide deacetylase family protein [Erythrobacter crassostreae]|uniref:Polysaccharide deacetylase family protein n=1 Tax=Erythrobacter crassostreae TaxID=2828328 RepID=A0A9X1F4E0_9SPHN|nr:polysaccharide deacetylase family protein [Erythrobacter crassostrea]MBV7259609.1 polysaccharide deacetylase family protein [Erythrobacter crassostrea]